MTDEATPIHTWDDGWTVHRLISKFARSRHSSDCPRHCVYRDTWDRTYFPFGHRLFAVRDASGAGQVTLLVCDTWQAIRGRASSEHVSGYLTWSVRDLDYSLVLDKRDVVPLQICPRELIDSDKELKYESSRRVHAWLASLPRSEEPLAGYRAGPFVRASAEEFIRELRSREVEVPELVNVAPAPAPVPPAWAGKYGR